MQVGEVDLYVETVGRGPTALVLHGGLGCDHTYLRPWLDGLCDVMSLVYYDHRGNGRSGGDAASLGWDTLTADAEALRRRLGRGPAIVIGHSFGGHVALEYALRYPRSVRQLVLVGTGARPAAAQAELVLERALRRHPELRGVLLAPDPETDEGLAREQRLLAPLYFHRYDPGVAKRLYANTIWRSSASARNAELLAAFDVRARLHEIRVPTLVVHGVDDYLFGSEAADTLVHGIPGARGVRFAQSGHLPFVEETAAFCSAVREFLVTSARLAEPQGDASAVP